MMKNDGNFLLGLILIVVGGLWVAGTMGLIEISLLYMLFRFWPVALIIAGLNILFKGNKIVLLLSVALFIGGGIYLAQSDIYGPKFFNWDYHFDNGGRRGDQIERMIDSYDLEGVEEGSLILNLGAGDIRVEASDNEMFEFNVPDYNLSYTSFTDNDSTELTFEHKKGFGPIGFNDDQVMKFDFKLPIDVVWTLDVDAGATDTRLDLQDLMMSKIDVDTGASDCQLTLGDLSDYTKVDIDTGVSDFRLDIKEGVGLKIKSDQVISDNNFDELGLLKIGGYYQTKGYDEASSKVEVDIDSAISDISISFYK